MSHTYDLICDQCRKKVWIGQGWLPESELTLYGPKTKDGVWLLRDFLAEHENHPLRFINSQLTPDGYAEIEGKDDD